MSAVEEHQDDQTGKPEGGDFQPLEPGAGLTPEAQADLDALMQQMEPEPGAQLAEQSEPAAVPAMSREESLSGLLELLFMPAEDFGLKQTAAIWTKEACDKVAKRAVPMLEKYTWGRAFLQWLDDGIGIEEMAFMMVFAPLAKRTFGALRADIAELRRLQASPAPEQQPEA